MAATTRARFSISKVIANSNILLILGIYVTTSFQAIVLVCKVAWSRRIKIPNSDPWAVKCVYRNVDWHCTSAGGQKGLGQVRVHDRVEEARLTPLSLLPGTNWRWLLWTIGGRAWASICVLIQRGVIGFILEADSAFHNPQPQLIGDNSAQILFICGIILHFRLP